jgi:hypothetical protein
MEKIDAKHDASNASQGKRVGDVESEIVAIKAVESERRRVREDTRGVPVYDEGKKGRGR